MCHSAFKIITLFLTLVFSAATFASYPFYIAAKTGVFHGYFSNNFTDQTDTIQQNISQDATQYGYLGTLALGYSQCCYKDQYLLGGEISGSLDNHQALYQAGAATAAFSDTIQILHHWDLSFIPGIKLNDSLAAYLKLGLSLAWIKDQVTSPVGFTPTLTNYNSTQSTLGAALGIGLKKFIQKNIFILTEANYHDYGNVNFATMQNFSATYAHSARVHSFDFVVGAAYQF